MTSTRQKSILRGSEIFGYDEKEYPERMLQRAAYMRSQPGVTVEEVTGE